MRSEPAWQKLASPPGEELRGLGQHEGELVALTSSGLFARRGEAWEAVVEVVATTLPCGRVVTAAPPPAGRGGDLTKLTAWATAPDGRRWVGIREDGLTFYKTPGEHGLDMLQPAHVVAQRIEVDGVVVRDGLAALDFAFDDRGRVWVATPMSLEVLDGETWRTALRHVTSQVAIAGDGTIVVGGPTAGFCSRDGVTFTKLPGRATEEGGWGSLDLPAEDVRQLERGPDGAIYARIDDGVLWWTGERWASRNLGLAMVPRVGSRDVRARSLAIVGDRLYVAAASLGVLSRRA